MKMKLFKSVLILIFIICAVLSLSLPVLADETEVQRYIVILDEPAVYSEERPTVFVRNEEMYRNGLREELIDMQNGIKAQIPVGVSLFSSEEKVAEEYSFTDVLNGFTITTDAETAEYIKEIDGVKDVFPDDAIATVAPEEPEADMEVMAESIEETLSAANSGNMINTIHAYENGYTGEGRTVAILDSNIYYSNDYFTLTDPAKGKYTKESLEDIFRNTGISLDAKSTYKSEKVPFAYDYASSSYTLQAASQHGTHVSGIAAGNKTKVGDGVVRGVAPEAQILFFGVVNSNGKVNFSYATKALDDAVKLKADAINMSFGDDYTSENSTSSSHIKFREAVRNAENAGCFVATSGGNAGRGNVTDVKNYDYSASDNNLFPNGANVGSVQNMYRVARKLTDEKGNDYASEVRSSVYELPLTEIVNCGSGTTSDISSVKLTGKVAVITKPDEYIADTDSNYYNRVRNAGAVALIMVNNSDQVKDTNFSFSYSSIPFYYMSKTEGERLFENATMIKCEKRLMIARSFNFPVASDTSSYGVSDTLDSTIDFSAPGGNIYSAYSSSYMPMSGTSMASPHVAGAGVLMSEFLEENYPGYTGKAKVTLIKNLLASTAENVYDESGALASVRRSGSGIIQLDKAMQTKVILHDGENASRITLGDRLGDEFTVSFYAENLSDTEVIFDSASIELSSDDYKNYNGKNLYSGIRKLNATFTGDSAVVVNPNSSKKVSFNVKLNAEDIAYLKAAMTNGFFVDGKVTLSVTDNTHPSVGIPFTGFYGEWDKIQVLDESEINGLLAFSTDVMGHTLSTKLLETDNGYEMPFTTNPDENIAENPLALSMVIRRNTFAKITIDDKVVYNGFTEKNTTATIKEFISENQMLSDSLKKNGKAEVKIEYTLPYKSQKQIINLTISPATEGPSIENIYVDYETGEKRVMLTVKGNPVAAVIREAEKNDGTVGNSFVKINKAEADIVDKVENYKTASYYVYDSAFNMTSAEHSITVEMEDKTAVFKNTTINEIEANCFLAVYDGKGLEKIILINKDDTVFEPYENITVDLTEYDGKDVKVFFWEADKIKPY